MLHTVLCRKSLTDCHEVLQPIKTDKGLLGLQNACTRKEDDYAFYVGQILHKKCRDEYRNEHSISRDLKQKQNTEKDLQSCSPAVDKPFDFGTDCLFCGQPAPRKNVDVSVISSFQCEKTLRDKCYERRDKWRQTVESRIETVNDLRAADAVYPQQCSSNFRTDRKIPMKRISDTQRSDTATQPAKKGKSGFVCVRILIRNIGDGS